MNEILDPSMVMTDLAILGRVALAGLLAGLVGWERETMGKSAGFRTHMLVGIASAMFVSLAEVILLMHQEDSSIIRMDPIRAVEAVATGIGFLGAGMIFLSRSGSEIKGLTTAASVWATGALGIAVGLGHYVLAVGATILLIIVLRILVRLDVR